MSLRRRGDKPRSKAARCKKGKGRRTLIRAQVLSVGHSTGQAGTGEPRLSPETRSVEAWNAAAPLFPRRLHHKPLGQPRSRLPSGRGRGEGAAGELLCSRLREKPRQVPASLPRRFPAGRGRADAATPTSSAYVSDERRATPTDSPRARGATPGGVHRPRQRHTKEPPGPG